MIQAPGVLIADVCVAGALPGCPGASARVGGHGTVRS